MHALKVAHAFAIKLTMYAYAFATRLIMYLSLVILSALEFHIAIVFVQLLYLSLIINVAIIVCTAIYCIAGNIGGN